MKDILTKKLRCFIENDTIFIQPEEHAKKWSYSHSFEVKRAGSVIVIQNNNIIKNILAQLTDEK